MRMQKETTTTREIEATEIPSGMKIKIPEGTSLGITQSLGGAYTVLTPYGYMARVDGKDADAIGEEVTSLDAEAAAGKTPGELAWDQLRTCYDPEIPVNIVDLGLVYKCEVMPKPEGGGGYKAEVRFTLTAPGCGMGSFIGSDARQKLLALPGVEDANVEIVWDPPWNPQMISPEGRDRLGMA